MLSALLIHGVPAECINQAAVTYYVPAKVIISVLETEGGWPGSAQPNKNGTHDYGPMQINSIWINKISPYGYTQEEIQYDACANVMAGTWILSQEIASDKNEKSKENIYWHSIGNYHSHTPLKNINYQQKVYMKYAELEEELNNVH